MFFSETDKYLPEEIGVLSGVRQYYGRICAERRIGLKKVNFEKS